jgi:choice-of-anchor C domain-containing protein
MLRKLMVSAAMTIGLAASASAATITNGSFEDHAAFSGGFTTLGTGSSALTGWTIDSGSVDLIGSYWEASDGVNSLDMSGGASGKISTMITDLIIGSRYLLSFDIAANPDGAPETKNLLVDVAGATNTVAANRSDSTRPSPMNWRTVTLGFTATNTSEALSFASDSGTAFGPALDNVRVAAVPLPATLPLALIGFGALGMLRRRKKA